MLYLSSVFLRSSDSAAEYSPSPDTSGRPPAAYIPPSGRRQPREVTSNDQTTSTVRIIRRETTDQKIRQTEDDVRDQIRQVISERDSTEDSTVIWRMLVRVWTDHRLMLFKYPGLWIGLFKITHRPNILYIRSRRMYCPSSCIITNLTLSSKCKLLDHTVHYIG